jgi:hypothetical protein
MEKRKNMSKTKGGLKKYINKIINESVTGEGKKKNVTRKF